MNRIPAIIQCSLIGAITGGTALAFAPSVLELLMGIANYGSNGSPEFWGMVIGIVGAGAIVLLLLPFSFLGFDITTPSPWLLFFSGSIWGLALGLAVGARQRK